MLGKWHLQFVSNCNPGYARMSPGRNSIACLFWNNFFPCHPLFFSLSLFFKNDLQDNLVFYLKDRAMESQTKRPYICRFTFQMFMTASAGLGGSQESSPGLARGWQLRRD